MPTFGFVTDGIPRACRKHRFPTHFDVVNKRCEARGCMRRPSFAAPGHPPAWCAKHANRTLHTDVRHPKCLQDGCLRTPYFGDVRDGVARYCSKHVPEDAVHLPSITCDVRTCTNRPQFRQPLHVSTSAPILMPGAPSARERVAAQDSSHPPADAPRRVLLCRKHLTDFVAGPAAFSPPDDFPRLLRGCVWREFSSLPTHASLSCLPLFLALDRHPFSSALCLSDASVGASCVSLPVIIASPPPLAGGIALADTVHSTTAATATGS